MTENDVIIIDDVNIPTEQKNPQAKEFENLTPRLDADKLKKIGMDVVSGYDADEDSRKVWKERYEQFVRLWYVRPQHETKNDPFEGASNIVIPIINIACSAFWARAQDALMSSKDVVKGLPLGTEADDYARAERVEKHMNYQVRFKMENFTEGMSKSMMQLPLSGTVIRKTYYDDVSKQNVSDFISPDNFVVNYYTRYLESSKRYTHVLKESLNDMLIKQSDKIYENVSDITNGEDDRSDIKISQDENAGVEPPDNDMFKHRKVLEQHVFMAILDRDGNQVKGEAIMQPYIIWVDYDSKKVLRIVSREVKIGGRKERIDFFTKYEFLPSPDDGFYGVGFGALIERSNELANTLINQLTDAGTLANTQSGFVNKRSGIKRGDFKLKRGRFTEVDFKGDDIRKSLMPMVFKEPSQVLFQLLGLIQDYANRVTTVSEMFTGELPKSDTSATAVVSLIEQGLKVFSAIYKGLHASFSKELQKLYKLNGIFLDEKEFFSIVINEDKVKALGANRKFIMQNIGKADYQSRMDVVPVSDPGIISKTEKVAKAQLLYQEAKTNPLIANNPVSLFRATDNFFSQIEDNEAIVESILEPVDQQIQMQIKAQEQAQQEQQNRQQALDLVTQQLAQGQVPPQEIAQLRKEQAIGAEMIRQQSEQQEVAQGEQAS